MKCNRSILSNESLIDSIKTLFKGKGILSLSNDKGKWIPEILKQKDKIEVLISTKETLSALIPLLSKINVGFLTVDGKIPSNLTDEYGKAKKYAIDGLKRMTVTGKEITSVNSKVNDDFEKGKIKDINKTIVDNYKKFNKTNNGLKYPYPLPGGSLVEFNNGKVAVKNNDVSKEGLSVTEEEIRKIIITSMKIIADYDTFRRDVENGKYYNENFPGVDTTEGIWRSDEVKWDSSEISSISDAVSSEGLLLREEEFYTTPIKLIALSAAKIIKLITDKV